MNNIERRPRSDLKILYEDNHLIAVNKCPSDIVQGDRSGDISLSELVKKYLEEKYLKKSRAFIGVVHRLDRPVSGIVLFARTSKALSRLNQMLQARQWEKIYWALVKDKPPKNKDTLTHYLAKNPQKNRSTAYCIEKPGSKKAILDYEISAVLEWYYLLQVQLHTGRHHQIRSQLSAIGCPIKGDIKYGADRPNIDGSIYLHARSLSLMHPIRKESLKIIAPPPDNPLWKVCEKQLAEKSVKFQP